MEYLWLIASILIALILFIIEIVNKFQSKKANKKRLQLFKRFKQVTLVLDHIKIDGLHWQENRPVDIYDNQLDPNGSKFNKQAHLGGYHKQKNLTKFKSTLQIPIHYLGQEYTYNTQLPVEHTILRMKFYQQKTLPIYIYPSSPTTVEFALDFTCLNLPNVGLMTTPIYNIKNT
ncbi:hypothetical protein [Olleya sp. ITB9]|uniref:hypothetical protein n=1 Tax=Olleya sp. ITB9 TaxID=1715648 RepID=UPI000A6F632B|nr:hypothetical protein [Olleya sp. ITB9]